MSDIKQNKTTSSEHSEYVDRLSRANGSRNDQQRSMPEPAKRATNGRAVNTWDAYRNWLTKVQAPEQRRSLPDPALFSWKGYRSWAEKVRRDWETEELANDP